MRNDLPRWADQYRWPKHASREASLARRASLETRVQSERRMVGRLSKEVFDAVLEWGFGHTLPVAESEIIQRSGRAFTLLSCGRLAEASEELMQVKGLGVSRATKLLALSDPEDLGIYDSRAAHGISDLTMNGRRCLPIPGGRSIPGDSLTDAAWATAFHRYVWVLRGLRALARDDPRTRDLFKRVADLEMAFFARSKFADDVRLTSGKRKTTTTTKGRRSAGSSDRRLPPSQRGAESAQSSDPSNMPSDQRHPSEREQELEAELYRLYKCVWPKLKMPPGYKEPYYARYLYRMFRFTPKRTRFYVGGIQAVKSRIRKKTSGRERLSNYPKLTLEGLVLSGKWDDLFDDDDRRIAKQKLSEMELRLRSNTS